MNLLILICSAFLLSSAAAAPPDESSQHSVVSSSTLAVQSSAIPPPDDDGPSSDEDYSDAFGHLVIGNVPYPPAHMFSIAGNNGAGVSGEVLEFFRTLQEFVREAGFDEISFSASLGSLQSRYAGLKAQITHDSEPKTVKMFQIASYYYELMYFYYYLLQKGLRGEIPAQYDDLVLVLMRELDFDISLLGYFDANGSFSVNSHFASSRKLDHATESFNIAQIEFKGSLSSAIDVLEPLINEHKKLAVIISNLQNYVLWSMASAMRSAAPVHHRNVARSEESVPPDKILEISKDIESLRNITSDARILLSKSSCVDLPLFDTWLCLLSFQHNDLSHHSVKWTDLDVPEVKELYDMLNEIHKKLYHLQEVYLWRISHDNDEFLQPGQGANGTTA